MKKVSEFSRQSLRVLREEINAALAMVAKDYGISIRTGNCSFTPESATMKLELGTIVNGTVIDRKVADFKRYCGSFGLEQSDLGKVIQLGGRSFTVTGLNPKSHKFPVSAKRDDGRMFKLKASHVNLNATLILD